MAAFGLADLEPVGLELRQPTAGLADATRDAPGEVDVIGIEVDVVGDQERPGADRDRAGRRVEARRPEVRLAPALVDLGLETLVLTPAHVRQALAVGPQRGLRVEVHRQLEAGRDPLAEGAREVDDVVDGGRAERDERDDVDRPDPRVLALMGVHVDLVDRSGDQALEGRRDGLVLAGDREHRAVVARVARPVEQAARRARSDGLGQPVDDVEPAALGDVRDGLDQHPLMLVRLRSRQAVIS